MDKMGISDTYNRFMVFGTHKYEELGGLHDCNESYHTFAEALASTKVYEGDRCYYEIFDRIEGKLVYAD